ncbi:MAG TPA: hypothetical protein DCQ84_11965 [Candidatus Competibacteraceae bacterium]|nr:hypothetical protein [Candidatus Competibacteraceae bacterium]
MTALFLSGKKGPLAIPIKRWFYALTERIRGHRFFAGSSEGSGGGERACWRSASLLARAGCWSSGYR